MLIYALTAIYSLNTIIRILVRVYCRGWQIWACSLI